MVSFETVILTLELSFILVGLYKDVKVLKKKSFTVTTCFRIFVDDKHYLKCLVKIPDGQ